MQSLCKLSVLADSIDGYCSLFGEPQSAVMLQGDLLAGEAELAASTLKSAADLRRGAELASRFDDNIDCTPVKALRAYAVAVEI